MSARREWRQRWAVVLDEDEAEQAADLTELVHDGEPVPGALLLTVYGRQDEEERWISLDYARLATLRDAIDAWLTEQGGPEVPRAELTP